MPHTRPHTLADFDYSLPPGLIAQFPLAIRSASRLLDGRSLSPQDRAFCDLPALLQPGDLLVFNNTKVLNARLRALKASGGVVEVLVERLLSPTCALTQLRASHAPKPGTRIVIAGKHHAEIVGRDDRFFLVQLESGDFESLMREAGELPLPPYMQRAAAEGDSERYVLPQETVDAISACRARSGRVVAVGTTSVRTLEGCVHECGELRAHQSETDIFITPGYDFKVVDSLLTNFHLPKSTLLMLVSAFAGYEHIRKLYAHAIEQRYRFFSYGDAMLLQKNTP